MADGDSFANVTAVIVGKVDDDVILHIGLRADDDFVDVAAQGRVIPHARKFVKGDAADDVRAGRDEGGWVDFWLVVEERFDGHGAGA